MTFRQRIEDHERESNLRKIEDALKEGWDVPPRQLFSALVADRAALSSILLDMADVLDRTT